jgi:retron-type reverse transcriptase
VTIEKFESDLKGNLYKIWNRMSSGAYFPPPVPAVSIPKKSGGQRILGVPTVADRVAQTVVKQLIEPALDAIRIPMGYRPGKSALDAVGVTRQRCWKYDWVLEFDIKGLFDNIDHELLLRAIRKHVTCAWALLYIERWLTAPMVQEHGTIIERSRGTPSRPDRSSRKRGAGGVLLGKDACLCHGRISMTRSLTRSLGRAPEAWMKRA